MKLSNIRRISREELQGAPDWIDSLLDPLNQATEQITQALMGQLELRNNQLAKVITQTFVQNVELRIMNPFQKEGLKPIGVVPLVSASPYTIDAWRYDYKSNGELGITMNFDIPRTDISLRLNANQTIINATETAIDFTTQVFNIGPGLTWSAATNPSRITAAIAGKYHVSYTGSYEPDAAGIREYWISKNGNIGAAGERWGIERHINAGATDYCASGACDVDLSVGDYFELWTYQNSGGNIDALGNSIHEISLMAHNINYTGYSADVTFIVYGG